MTLLRIMGKEGEILRGMFRGKHLYFRLTEQPGKAFTIPERDRMMAAARKSQSPVLLAALTLALNTGARDCEIRRTRWSQVDFAKGVFTVGRSKTAAGEGRTIPLNGELRDAPLEHAKWYATKLSQRF